MWGEKIISWLTALVILVGIILMLLIISWVLFRRGDRTLAPWNLMRDGSMDQNFRISLHGYAYGRWTNRYMDILIHYTFPSLLPIEKGWVTNRYHGKVLTEEHAELIITLDKDIPLQDLESIIPYSRARDMVINAPPEIAVYECACRHAREDPCQPSQVCMVIGQPFVDLIMENRPNSSRRLTKEEALQLLREEHERGHIHCAWFKDVLMNRFYAICNCCKCCCGGIEAMTKYDIPIMASSGYVSYTDHALCNGCGICTDLCPFNARIMIMNNSTVDWETCMGCGVCTSKCPEGAISLIRDEKKGEPLDVRLLTEDRTG